jgi:TIR domain
MQYVPVGTECQGQYTLFMNPGIRGMVVVCATADMRLGISYIDALAARGYEAEFPPTSLGDGRTAAVGLITDTFPGDAAAMEAFRSIVDTEIAPTVAVVVTDQPLPLFLRNVPQVDGRGRSVAENAEAIGALVAMLPPVVVVGEPSPEERERRGCGPVFLSYAREDRADVEWLHFQLTQSGFRPWLDTRKLVGGQEWEYEVRRAIRGAAAVVFCISKRSVSKFGFVQKELRFALDVALEAPEGVNFLIPLRLDDAELPEKLRHLHALDDFAQLVAALDHRMANVR